MKKLICLVLIIVFSHYSYSAILVVPADYPTIQTAIDAASVNDTVLVNPGTYNERLVIDSDAITLASQAIYGDSTFFSSTIITGNGVEEDQRLLEITGPLAGDTLRIIGLSFINHSITPELDDAAGIIAVHGLIELRWNLFENLFSNHAAAVFLDSTEAIVKRNQFMNNTAFVGGGLVCYSGTYTIENNRFIGNQATGNASGALVTYLSYAWIRSNHFEDNYALVGAGACLIGGFDILLANNVYINNHGRMGGAVATGFTDRIHIINNKFIENSNDTTSPISGTGSAIHISASTDSCYLDSNLFIGNSGDWGGTVCIRGNTRVSNCYFSANQAESVTSIYLGTANGTPVDVTVENCIFRDNVNSGRLIDHIGQFFAETSCTLSVHNCDFIDNVDYIAMNSSVHRGDFELDNNYWGHPTGPYHRNLNPEGRGDSCSVSFDPSPWMNHPINTGGLQVSELFPEAELTMTGDTSTVRVYLRNLSDEELDIEEITSDSLFVVPEADLTSPISPGDSLTIDLHFIPLDEGLKQSTIHIIPADTLTAPIRLWFNGEGELNDIGEPDNDGNLPERFSVSPPWPNPANHEVRVALELPVPSDVTVVVSNLLGQQVRQIDIGQMNAGIHPIAVSLNDLASGAYFLEIRTQNQCLSAQRITLLR